MKKEESKITFDLAKLSLNELIKVYEDINSFLQYLNEVKILPKEEEEKKNE